MTAAPLHEAPGLAPPVGGSARILRATDGVRLRAAHWPSTRPEGRARGTALLFQGRTEFVEKHYETITRLLGLGFAVTTIDWRGQGLSDRPLADRRKGHVGNFSEFQLDVNALAAEARRVNAPDPWIIVAHSMGGAIAARAMMRQAGGGRRWRAKAAVLSAPMLGLAGSASFLTVSMGASSAAVAFGLSNAYAPGGSDQPYVARGFAGNLLTSDQPRFDAYAELVRRRPELALGGPTWGWVRAAFAEMRELRPTQMPTLFALGSEEQVVSPEAVRSFAGAAPNGRLLELPGARHEPFFETDAIQGRLWPEIDRFLVAQGV